MSPLTPVYPGYCRRLSPESAELYYEVNSRLRIQILTEHVKIGVVDLDLVEYFRMTVVVVLLRLDLVPHLVSDETEQC